MAVAALLFLGQALIGGGVAHYRAEPGDFFGLDLSVVPAEQPAAHLAPATRHLVDRDRLCRRCAVRGRHAGPQRAGRAAPRHPSAVRRRRRRRGRQPARRMGRHPAMAGRGMVLVRQPGLGISRDRPGLADPAGDRPRLLVRPVVAQRGAGAARSRAPRTDRVLPDRRRGNPGILSAGASVRRHHPLHDRRHLAVLDHPSVGRGLLRAVRHRHRRHHFLRARAGRAQHGAPRHLPRRHPDLRRRADRHRASLVLQRPDRAQHGAVLGVLGARGGSPDADHARCLGLRHRDAGRGQRAVPAQMDVLFPDGRGVLELHRRRHLRIPHQHADRQLLRDGHQPHAQSRPCRDDGRVRHAGHRADGVRPAPDDVRRGLATPGALRSLRLLGTQHRSRDDGGPQPVSLGHPADARRHRSMAIGTRAASPIRQARCRGCSNGCACRATWCSSSWARCRSRSPSASAISPYGQDTRGASRHGRFRPNKRRTVHLQGSARHSAATASPICSQVGATSDTVARRMSRW